MRSQRSLYFAIVLVDQPAPGALSRDSATFPRDQDRANQSYKPRRPKRPAPERSKSKPAVICFTTIHELSEGGFSSPIHPGIVFPGDPLVPIGGLERSARRTPAGSGQIRRSAIRCIRLRIPDVSTQPVICTGLLEAMVLAPLVCTTRKSRMVFHATSELVDSLHLRSRRKGPQKPDISAANLQAAAIVPESSRAGCDAHGPGHPAVVCGGPHLHGPSQGQTQACLSTAYGLELKSYPREGLFPSSSRAITIR